MWGAVARVPYGALLPWSFWQRLTPFSSGRGSCDSCVIGNGIPRSGTYLVNNILRTIGGWENIGVHVNPRMWDTWQRDRRVTVHPCLARFAIKKLRNGQVIGAHLPWSEALEQVMGQASPDRCIKHVFIHRDPRDTFVSYLNWVTYSPDFLTTAGGREFRKFMLEQFDDDDQRLSHIIRQPQHSHSVYLSYEPWLRSPRCLAIKFEDLYPEVADLQHSVVGPVLEGLFRYLEIDPDRIDLRDLNREVYGQSVTVIGRYRQVFKDQHYAYLDNPEFKHTLRAFSYEN